MSRYNKIIGNYGENICEEYLIKHGHKILHRNFRCKLGELDIISKIESSNCICFTEVKSRYTHTYGTPCESITYKKILRIRNIAQYYIIKNNLNNFNFRFDVIEVLFNIEHNNYSLNLIKNAF